MPDLRRAPHPYTAWEDYRAGMYDTSPTPDLHVSVAASLLAAARDLEAAMRAACAGWPNAAEHRLTAPDQNRRAWLGAAACWWIGQCPEHTTRTAWWHLAVETQRAANVAADRTIRWWEIERTGEYPLFTMTPTGVIGHA